MLHSNVFNVLYLINLTSYIALFKNLNVILHFYIILLYNIQKLVQHVE